MVEFALVAPVLFLILIGMIEFGRMIMVEQVLTNASREGARRGILEKSTQLEVQQVVTSYLTNSRVSGATVTVTPSALGGLGFGDQVTVHVSVPYNQVSWLPAPWFLGGTNLTAECVMYAERPE